MTEAIRTGKRRRWPKILAAIAGVLVILLAAAYLAATSEAFLKRFILPKVSDSMNADVTVGSASISPFSRVVLRDLKVHPRGTEPLVSAQEIRARYSLLSIIRGNIKVDEVVLAAPVVEVVTHPDGTSNLDPLLQGQKKQKTPAPSKPSQPPNIDLRNLSLVNATVRQIKQHKSGKPDVTELTGLNVNVANVRNGQPGKLTLSSDVRMEATNGVLQAKLGGDFDFGLSSDLKPTALKGESRFQVGNVSGAFGEVAGLSATLIAEATPTEVRQLVLKFMKNNDNLGEIRAAGPLDLAKTEGRLNVVVSSIDRNVLNLAGAQMGLDFGKTLINSSNQVELGKGGKVATVNGIFNVAQFNIQKTNAATPPVDIVANYNVSVDTAGQVAKLQTLTVNGTQQNKRLLQLEVPSPMTITWGNVVVPTGDSALNLAVTDLNVADWKPFLETAGVPLQAGTVNLSAKVTSQESGKQLRLEMTNRVDNVAVAVQTNTVSEIGVATHLRATLTDLDRLKISQLFVQTMHKGEPFLTLSGSGEHNQQSKSSDVQLSLDADVPRIAALMPQPGVKASSGALTFNGRFLGGQQSQTITGLVALTNFTGQLSGNQFANYGIGANMNVRKTAQAIELREIAGNVSRGPQPGGTFTLTGNYNPANGAAQLDLKLNGLNENALGPFLAAPLKEKKLVSVALNGNANVRYNTNAASTVKSDIQLTKLVVSDPEKKIPATPLEARFQLDGALDQKVLDLKQARVGLTPTQRAKNELDLTGRLDITKSNALEGALKLQADALDLTAYYDLFAGQSAAASAGSAAPGPTATRPAAPPPAVEKEPAPTQLPVRNLALEANIGRLYLRELDIADIHASPQIESSRVRTGPIQLKVNGAPVEATAEVDLSVPGYKYVLSSTFDHVPLEPFVNTFKPEERGKMKGELITAANISGVGTTGPNLKKHLEGQLKLDLTNGYVKVDSVKIVSNIIVFVATRFKIPELLESPIQQAHVEAKIGGGQIQVTPADFISALFAINTGGTIQIADVLTNSPIQSWPVNLSLRRSVAGKVPKEILAESRGTNEYVKVANFIRIVGTLGKPDKDIDEKAIAGQLIEQVGKRIGNENAQNVLKGLGGLLGGRQGATNAPAGTNAIGSTNSPSTNRPAPLNPLDLLKPKK